MELTNKEYESLYNLIESNQNNMGLLSDKLTGSDSFVLKVLGDLSENGLQIKNEFFANVSDRLKNSELFCYQVIKTDPFCLEFMPDHIKDNDFIVMEALNREAFCLQFASERFSNDKELVISILQDANQQNYYGDDLKQIALQNNLSNFVKYDDPVKALETAIKLEQKGIQIGKWDDVFKIEQVYNLKNKIENELPIKEPEAVKTKRLKI